MSALTKPPVDEDVDDLDDVLDQFTSPASPKIPGPPPPTSIPTASITSPVIPTAVLKSTTAAPNPLEDIDEDFARELAKGMESLMAEIAASGSGGAGSAGAGGETEEEEKEKAFRAAWEAMLIEGMDEAIGAKKPEGADAKKGKGGEKVGSGSGTKPEEEDAFQKTIRQAMDKLKESESSLQADATPGTTNDSLEALLSQLNTALGEGDGETEGELQGLLESMMGQLMSKEVLYEPLKELQDKFPSYLVDNASTISSEDKKRYDSQFIYVKKIVAIFEDPTYKDDDTEKGAVIVNLMNEMQSYGSPPAEIMGPLPPGFDLGPDGLPKVPDNCVIA
ncbi:hypothetical protein JAAARDRAFT_40687 [Jaapia argillacea MUCL 33604]|uniref:Pex19-domain-containing protein n=1 Tax=Jaapia argillacea MUCL 33604 TaxID=933084 RepID=A0A067PLG3_9AGAM|nr:hypothetical protein JAAARDRAFT_40687 [Jaapia argillacea MUCL 33604]